MRTIVVIAIVFVFLNVILAFIKICQGYNSDRLSAFLGWLTALLWIIVKSIDNP